MPPPGTSAHVATVNNFPLLTTDKPTQFHVQPPDETYWVYPPSLPAPADKRNPKYTAVPEGRDRHPHILLGYQGEWNSRVSGLPNHGHRIVCHSRESAVAAILQHYLNKRAPPENLCLNCSLFTLGHAGTHPETIRHSSTHSSHCRWPIHDAASTTHAAPVVGATHLSTKAAYPHFTDTTRTKI